MLLGVLSAIVSVAGFGNALRDNSTRKAIDGLRGQRASRGPQGHELL
jgi:hypothetical protein